ncbi:UNVERIFIED_CONTAM: Long chain acyl-CoA synthetase 7, peroxisomal [Sesamum radiatum]|uniref:Long chain acyl-CoA synthetase 7, peroxisomal n=1 Tax=Sesamum radiatum TaxID=300843 RepID=A0AAW2S700_SESRA
MFEVFSFAPLFFHIGIGITRGQFSCHRSARSPMKLVNRYPEHPEIGTLHDNFVYISYLPLAHIYERANQIIAAYYGVAVGFYQGYEDLGKLCADPRARAAVLAEMDAIGKEAQLRGFEFAKSVTLVPEPFTVENGLLTPTFKIKRPQAKAYFAQAISMGMSEICGLVLYLMEHYMVAAQVEL